MHVIGFSTFLVLLLIDLTAIGRAQHIGFSAIYAGYLLTIGSLF